MRLTKTIWSARSARVLSGRDVFQRVEHAQELDVVEMIGADPPSERRQIVGQDLAVGFDVDRQGQRKIDDVQATFIVAQTDFAVLQALAVEAAQERREHLPFHALIGMIPLNVEEVGVGRSRTVLKHVHEQPVLRIVGHVIGHDVLQPAEPGAAAPKRPAPRTPRRCRAQG